MEPIQRRRIDSPQPRSIMGGPARVQPGQSSALRPFGAGPAQPAVPTTQSASALRPAQNPAATPQPHGQPSLLRPASMPANGGTSMDFRPAAPAATPLQPHHTPSAGLRPANHPVYPTPHTPSASSTAPQPTQPVSAAEPTAATTTAAPTAEPAQQAPKLNEPLQFAAPAGKVHKEPHPTGHASLVGFVTFIVLGIITFAPFVPGKIWEDAPGSSQSMSTGDQNIGCISDVTNLSTSTSYDHKIGFPVVYNYATTSTLSGDCNGKSQHAVGGHTAQFNPLALAIDVALTLILAIVTAKIWRRFRGVRS